MFLGIDVGTSAVKTVLVDARQTIVANADQPLSPINRSRSGPMMIPTPGGRPWRAASINSSRRDRTRWPRLPGGQSRLLALPYLHGERTPHNDRYARGAVIGMTGSTEATEIIQAVLEGVAFSLADGDRGAVRDRAADGAARVHRRRSAVRILGSHHRLCPRRHAGAPRRCRAGPSFRAARLSRLCATGESANAVIVTPSIERIIEPVSRLADLYRPRLKAFRNLYVALRPLFRDPAPA